MAMYPKSKSIDADNSSCNSENKNMRAESTSAKSRTKATDDSFLSTQQREQLGENDIICSKNSFAHKHSGNRRYNSLIAKHRQAYQSTKQRYERTFITTQVISTIEKDYGGRFVKLAPTANQQDNDSDCWIELGHEDKREKVAHALRSASDPLTKYKRRKRSTATTNNSNNNSELAAGRITPQENHLPKKKRKVNVDKDDISSVSSSSSVSSFSATNQLSPRSATSPEQQATISLSTLASAAAAKELDVRSVHSKFSQASIPLTTMMENHNHTQALLSARYKMQEEEEAILLARQILQSRRATASLSPSLPQTPSSFAGLPQPNALLGNPFLTTRALADTSLDLPYQLFASQQLLNVAMSNSAPSPNNSTGASFH
mmetsp:Transcript_14201/g.31014  ORF Transcript_14201/g.31014 Transcript_14201/m.31014 type:complete len:375 (+) Transcript_14201:170-1294(+)